ncbi:putative F-box protein At4g17200 isoform X2 [Primulina huaijiensis]|uniref:putative F-box protein At4g17200 isoform X2 n=1 Tax=Primulina huaijiensis TaxID=1492673 RepID=UPI003CC75972
MPRKKRPQSKQLVDADGFCEPKTEIQVGGLWNLAINPYHCCKRCAKKRQRKDFLPLEMVYEVLLRLPALVLFDVMRHVCRDWSLMIRSRNFIHDHLLNSPRGLMIQSRHMSHSAIFVEMRAGCLEISKFDRVFCCLLWTSCNGLVLTNFRDRHHLYIANPMTKQQLLLPRFFCRIVHHGRCGLAFVEASMKYKVVQPYDYSRGFEYVKCAVLTIGVDQVWRHIDIEHLSLTARRAFMSFPLVCGGFMYWVGETVLLIMNVDTEIVSQFPIPPFGKKYQKILPMGSKMSIIATANDILWDVWEMNPEILEWSKLLSFDLEPQSTKIKKFLRTKMEHIEPVGWLIDREVLVFHGAEPQRYLIAYNVKTGEAQPIKLDMNDNYHIVQAHVNSLGWLE